MKIEGNKDKILVIYTQKEQFAEILII